MELLEKIGIPGFRFYISERFIFDIPKSNLMYMDWFEFEKRGKIPYLTHSVPFIEFFLNSYRGKIDCNLVVFKEFGEKWKNLRFVEYDNKIHFKVDPMAPFKNSSVKEKIVVFERDNFSYAKGKAYFLDLFIDSNSSLKRLFFDRGVSIPEYMKNTINIRETFLNGIFSEIDFLFLNQIVKTNRDFVFNFWRDSFFYSYFVLNGNLHSFFIHRISSMNKRKLEHLIVDMVSGVDIQNELILDCGVFSKVRYEGEGNFFKSYEVFDLEEKKFVRRLIYGY